MPKRIIKKIKNIKNHVDQHGVKSIVIRNKEAFFKIIFLTALILIGYTGFSVFNSFQAKKYSEILHESLLAQNNGDKKLARDKLIEIYNSSLAPSTIKALASIRYAGLLLEDNKKQDAVKIFIEVSDCFFCNKYLADLSGYLAISTLMSDQELIKNDYSSQVKKIFKNSKILKWQIAEQRGFYEMQKNNLKLADEIFAEIEKNQDADKSIKSRAKDARKMLIQKGLNTQETNNDNKKVKDNQKTDLTDKNVKPETQAKSSKNQNSKKVNNENSQQNQKSKNN